MVSWREEQRPCPICGGSRYRELGARGGWAHHRALGEPTMVVRCATCHGVYSKPFLLPTGNPYSRHSGDEYFWLVEASAKRRSGALLGHLARSLTGSPERLLELGCGTGQLLAGAREAGWIVRGVEMTEAFATQAREAGIDVEMASVESCTSLDQPWGCILLAAILEHLYDPRACLVRVHQALLPGGVAFIDVPNECSLWTRVGNGYMRLRRRRWAVNLSPTFPPYHVVGFCPRSLRWLLSELGFEIVEMRTYRWCNALPKRDSMLGQIEALAAEVVLSAGAWVGSGAGITAWVRKPRRD